MNGRTTIAVLAIAAFSTGTLVGCSVSGNGPWLDRSDLTGETTTQSRSLHGFTGIALSGNATLTVTQGDSFSVAVTTDSGLQEHIDTSVRGSTLEIEQHYSIAGRSPDVSVAVTLPRLDSVDLSGSSATTIEGVRGESLHVSSSGSSDIHIDAAVKALAVDVSGSGDIQLMGTAGSADIAISGAGTVSGAALNTTTANVSVSGVGDVTLSVAKTLDVDLSGAGDITYYGDPEVRSEVSGLGRVHRAESS